MKENEKNFDESIMAESKNDILEQLYKYLQKQNEELLYKVYEIKIIDPDDIDDIMIEEGQDILTLITCHPYRVNTKRYVVKAKRI